MAGLTAESSALMQNGITHTYSIQKTEQGQKNGVQGQKNVTLTRKFLRFTSSYGNDRPLRKRHGPVPVPILQD